MPKLILIPARAGSKGLPGKNVKKLDNKPLIGYSIEFALQIIEDGDLICVSSNDEEVLKIAENYGLRIFFKRPDNLSGDGSSMNDVILHSLEHFNSMGYNFESILLLQPTTPFRIVNDFESLKTVLKEDCDMAVTVRETKDNPYFTLFEENESGYLRKSKEANAVTRQEVPLVYAYNGSMYLMKVSSLKEHGLHGMQKIKKLVLPAERSIDIDDMKDWTIAEYYIKKQKSEDD